MRNSRACGFTPARYTNYEFYEFTWPYNDDLPYIYDSYSYWPACAMQNISFYDTDDV